MVYSALKHILGAFRSLKVMNLRIYLLTINWLKSCFSVIMS